MTCSTACIRSQYPPICPLDAVAFEYLSRKKIVKAGWFSVGERLSASSTKDRISIDEGL